MTLRAYRPPLPIPVTGKQWHVISECYRGRKPAKALDPAWREELVTTLLRKGWTHAEIAQHTRMTRWAVARIELLAECRAGRCPAEVLDTGEREQLVRDLVLAGWTDLRIATHTRMTTYTTVRIRERLGLTSNTETTLGKDAAWQPNFAS